MNKRLFIVSVILFSFNISFALTEDSGVLESLSSSTYPQSYRGISLGMDIETVKQQLLADSLFGYRGDRDLSLLSGENRSLIETVGYSFIRRSWFQFLEERLYVMTFNLDFSRIDYFSLYSSLVAKYGEPTTLDPKKALWQDESVILSLERPLTIKYIDLVTFNAILQEAGTQKAASDILRENFLSEF
ncbi:MAG TPA: hypothetical protein VJ861_08415 [Treponemataceae bacterium]|nr:hypothetical protein [Treponemataceae bacterium]